MNFWRALVSVLLVLGPMVYFGIEADAGKMGIAAAAGAAAAMLLNIDRLKSLKLGIMEAQLTEKIQEATATLAALQDLAAETLAYSIQRVTMQGRLAGANEVAERDAEVEKMRAVAGRMDVGNDPRVTEAVRQHHQYMAFDIYGRLGTGYPTDAQKELHGLTQKRTHLPDREETMAVFARHGVDTLKPETIEKLEEYLGYRGAHEI